MESGGTRRLVSRERGADFIEGNKKKSLKNGRDVTGGFTQVYYDAAVVTVTQDAIGK